MKKLITIIALSTLIGCQREVEYRWTRVGEITTLRIDDDAEYHFSTDRVTESDVSKELVYIYRKEGAPTLFIQEERCTKNCMGQQSGWSPVGAVAYSTYRIDLPKNYKIETFND